VSVGVVVLERCDSWPQGLADSKELTPGQREALIPALREYGLGRAVGQASAAEIDAGGIVAALRLAGMRALAALADAGLAPDAILLDGRHDWLTPPAADLFDDAGGAAGAVAPVTMVVKGDRLCASIAAASVLAKVERDGLMRAAHAEHPEYGWEGNKGYGAAAHLDAIRELGTTPWHRRSWRLPATSECRVPA